MGEISNCYSTGTVSGYEYVGGLVEKSRQYERLLFDGYGKRSCLGRRSGGIQLLRQYQQLLFDECGKRVWVGGLADTTITAVSAIAIRRVR